MPSKTEQEQTMQGSIALLPLRDMVIFPGMVVPLLVGRPASLAAVEESLESEEPLFLVAQRDSNIEEPGPDDFYTVGVAANILQTLRMPDGTMKVVVEAMGRGDIEAVTVGEDMVEVVAVPRVDKAVRGKEAEALMRTVLNQFEEYVRLSQRVAPEVVVSLRSVTDAAALSDMVCAYLSVRVEERQKLLEVRSVKKRLERMSELLMRENELLGIEQKVRDRVRDQMERGQREYYLQEQLKVIHQELGHIDEGTDEYTELHTAIEKARMPREVKEKALRELGRYTRMPAMSPESTVVRTYLEWLLDLPWRKMSRDSIDLEKAQAALDEDHYGLEKVKERILEFLAVKKLSKSARGPVLCLVGPPGVGKTSLGQSIARAMGRKFVRVSLGGIRDEAEIRGHRRTYVGALPGRIIQSLKKVGVRNPLFMLDEVDKLTSDYRGDPSSALLEVLDPEQNHSFSDHYLEVDFDLSSVFFIATANNDFDIPPALHDRLEIVRLPGYTIYEKERIARLFLVPRQLEQTGLAASGVKFTDGAIDRIIQRYTREAGVRELERRLAAVCRKVARKVVSKTRDDTTDLAIDTGDISSMLGPEAYPELRAEAEPEIGMATGLAWTGAGGDILAIETSVMKGKGRLVLTGHLGEIMKESAQAAYSYIRTHDEELGVTLQFHKTRDLHVHVPEGAIPKDGPSAGIAIAVSMLSALLKKAPMARLAMTGEITLRGRVLPVGGVKEKVLAAHRAGIRTIILPDQNEKDLVEIPEEVRKDITFKPVRHIDETLGAAFGDGGTPA